MACSFQLSLVLVALKLIIVVSKLLLVVARFRRSVCLRKIVAHLEHSLVDADGLVSFILTIILFFFHLLVFSLGVLRTLRLRSRGLFDLLGLELEALLFRRLLVLFLLLRLIILIVFFLLCILAVFFIFFLGLGIFITLLQLIFLALLFILPVLCEDIFNVLFGPLFIIILFIFLVIDLVVLTLIFIIIVIKLYFEAFIALCGRWQGSVEGGCFLLFIFLIGPKLLFGVILV